jgi:hypothetical protein
MKALSKISIACRRDFIDMREAHFHIKPVFLPSPRVQTFAFYAKKEILLPYSLSCRVWGSLRWISD